MKSAIIIAETIATTLFSRYEITTEAIVGEDGKTMFSSFFCGMDEDWGGDESFTETFPTFEQAAAYINAWCRDRKARAVDMTDAFVVSGARLLRHGWQVCPGEPLEVFDGKLETTFDLAAFDDYDTAETFMMRSVRNREEDAFESAVQYTYTVERRRLAKVVE